jgi:hypothetical protein
MDAETRHHNPGNPGNPLSGREQPLDEDEDRYRRPPYEARDSGGTQQRDQKLAAAEAVKPVLQSHSSSAAA